MQMHFAPAPGQLSGAWAGSIARLILQREGLPALPEVGSGVQRVLVLHQLGGPGSKLPAASTLRETTFSWFSPYFAVPIPGFFPAHLTSTVVSACLH